MKFRYLFTFITIPMFASCNINDETIVNDWSTQDKQIFENHLYGYVLDYEVFKGNKVEYFEDENYICVSGVESSHELLESYCSSLEDDGFIFESKEDNYYTLHKIYEVDGTDKYLCVDMGGMNLEGSDYNKDGTGTFTMFLFDPYTYFWPTEDVKIAVDTLTNESGTSLPAYPNVLQSRFIVEEYQTSGYVYVYVDTNDKKPVDIYENTLENAGFSVLKGQNIAYSKKGDLAVEYYVDEIGYFVIGFRSCVRQWPTQKIATEISRFYPESKTLIPEIAADEYIVNTVVNYRAIIIYAMGADMVDIDTFILGLNIQDWKIDKDTVEDYAYNCVPQSEDFSLKIILKEKYAELQIIPYFKPSQNWPTIDAQKIVDGLLTKGTIPAYSGICSSYLVQDEEMYKGIVCYVGKNNEGNAVKLYENQLETLGYEVVATNTFGDKYYCYPGTELILSPQFLDSGSFTIDISRKDFADDKIPVDAMNRFLSYSESEVQLENFDITTSFNGVDTVNWAFNSAQDGTFFQCFIKLDEVKNEDFMNEVSSLLESNGFVFKDDDTDYGKGKIYTKDDVSVVLYFGIRSETGTREDINQFLIELNVGEK